MKKHVSLVILLTFLVAICAAPVWAQTGTVKGVAKDQRGKPIEGATVEIFSAETGRKVDLKTNAKGEYFSIGVPIGTYKFSLIKDGKVIDFFSQVPVGGDERVVDFDLAKDIAQAEQKAGKAQNALGSLRDTARDAEKAK